MQLTKEQAIAEHRKMWNWIADQYEKRTELLQKAECVEKLKHFYINNVLPGEMITCDCFCCEYDDKFGGICDQCPIDFNEKEIKVSNVFNHDRYKREVEELLHKCTDIEDFSDKLRSATMYYFWSKCEWETVIHPWVGDDKAAKKIDVFWQLKNNWKRFVEYLWEMR